MYTDLGIGWQESDWYLSCDGDLFAPSNHTIIETSR